MIGFRVSEVAWLSRKEVEKADSVMGARTYKYIGSSWGTVARLSMNTR